MKRTLLAMILVVVALLSAAQTALAQAEPAQTEPAQTEPARRTAVRLTFGGLGYTEAGDHKSGPCGGLEVRTLVTPDWALTAGLIGGSDIGLFTDELSITSVELGAARMIPTADEGLSLALGGGFAAVRGEYTDLELFEPTTHTTAWVLGAQVHAGLDWVPGLFAASLKVVYQLTQGFEDSGWGLDNWRVMVGAGLAF